MVVHEKPRHLQSQLLGDCCNNFAFTLVAWLADINLEGWIVRNPSHLFTKNAGQYSETRFCYRPAVLY